VSLASLAAEVCEQQMWAQFEETWGHLYPKPGDHPGYLVVVHSDYNHQGVVVVDQEFQDVENSPWFYDWMTHFAFESMAGVARWIWKKRVRDDGTVHRYRSKECCGARKTGIWEFRGVLRVNPSGKARFVGKWTKMSLYPGRIPATKTRRHFGYIGTKLAHKDMLESDNDFMNNNRFGAVRFLETMNARRGRGR